MLRSNPWRALAAALLAAFLGGVLVASPAAGRPSEAPDRLRLSYHVWQGGFHAFTLRTEMNHGAESYDASFSATTDGLVGWLFPYRVEGRSKGTLVAAPPKTETGVMNGFRPRRFESASRKGDKEKQREITYLDDGSLEVRHEPPRDDEPLAEPLLRDTLDPVTALYAMIGSFDEVRRCAGRLPVFDGRRRYDLKLKQLGAAQLEPSDYGIYSGPAMHCRVTLRPIAGFKKKRKSLSRLPRRVEVWLAPLKPGGPAVPVRLEGENPWGRMVVHLISAESGGTRTHASR
jgi:hypothetical protein